MASLTTSDSEQKEQTNKEKYAFYSSVSQIHINPEKHEKNTKMTSSDVQASSNWVPGSLGLPVELLRHHSRAPL